MLSIEPAATEEDLQAILELQARNMPEVVGDGALASDGFVSVRHDLALLRTLHASSPHIIARHEGAVVGYALGMSRTYSNTIEMLRGVFLRIEELENVASDYVVCGQVCVAKNSRGQGIFRRLYQEMGRYYAKDYSAIITAIDERNERSLGAHFAVGFEQLLRFADSGRTWVIVRMTL